MSQEVVSSIIIPVFNKWKLTKNCLLSLHKTLAGQCCEVIIVDNASSDETQTACPALGKELFNDLFIYHRFGKNCNFGPASNFGAHLASGKYLVFLNNDTEALPGWHEKLLEDFSTYPSIAATGPILMYPPSKPLGDTIQHLGVFVSPKFCVDHLYEGIPASSPLAKKRRFFQVITAACMMIPKSLFFQFNGFDERYINGFEDVDLCARLNAQGYKMTVNPDAYMYHFASQTPGRHTHEEHNSKLLRETSLKLIVPDLHSILQEDGYALELSPWLRYTISRKTNTPEEKQQNKIAAIIQDPFDIPTYMDLARRYFAAGDAVTGIHLIHPVLQYFPPESLLELLGYAQQTANSGLEQYLINRLDSYFTPFETYKQYFYTLTQWHSDIGFTAIPCPPAWEDGGESFKVDYLLPFYKQMKAILPARYE